MPVDPETAFTAFTEELDLWWVRGPINHHAAGRMRAMRCEPGVGGRLLEVYDEETGQALELGRITEWEPGKRLAWRSSIDDVEAEVTFAAVAEGTNVSVLARIPAGGTDRGGTSWVRVVPPWFGPWCGRRETAGHEVGDIARLALAVSYARPAAAARLLASVFAFQSPDPLPDGDDSLPHGDHGHPWIEFRLGNGSLMLFPSAPGRLREPECASRGSTSTTSSATTRRPWPMGATILQELASPWGLPFYVASDPEGNRWRIAQARPTMA